MFRSGFGPLDVVKKWLNSRTGPRSRKAPRRRPALAVETLESRLTPAARLVATSFFDSAVYEFNADTGAVFKTLVTPYTSTLLSGAAGLTVGPDGNLYISSQALATGFKDAILEYDLSSNTLSTFIDSSVLQPIATSTGASVFSPAGLRFGPDGNLYVSLNGGFGAAMGSGAVIRFGITSSGGALSYSGTHTTIASGLTEPAGLTFGTTLGEINNLYVSNSGEGDVVKITGATGATPTTATFIAAGTSSLEFPAGLTFGPDGKLYVVDLSAVSGTGNVLQFNANGTFNEVFTHPTDTLTNQFPSDALFDTHGDLITANLGPNHPPDLLGSIDVFGPTGTFSKTLVNSGQFPNTGFGSGISPSQLVYFPNQNPTITLPGGTVNYTEGQPPVVLDSGATATDPDSTTFATGTLTVTLTANGTADDQLGIQNEGTGANQIGVSGSNVTFGGTVIGTFTGGTGTTPLVITFNANSSPAAAQELLRNITFSNGSQNPSTADRTVQLVLTDEDGAASNTVTRTVTVTAVNNPPVVTTNTGLTVDEGATVPLDQTELAAPDPDNTPAQLTYTVTSGPTHGTLLKSGSSVTSFTQGDLNTGLLSYQQDGSEVTSDTFQFTVSDGTNTTAATDFNITVNPTPPVVATNTGLTVAQGAAGVIGQADLETTDPHDTPAQLTYTVTTGPAHGTLLKGGSSVTSFTQDDLNNNLISYQQDNSKHTSDSFNFKVGDGIAATGTNTFHITVTLQPPVVTTDTGLTLDEGATAVLSPTELATTDPGTTPAQLTYTVTMGPTHGTLLLIGAPATSFTQDDIDNGRVSYQNDGSKNTNESFTFTVSDGIDTTAATSFNIDITLLPPTVATNMGLTANEGATATLGPTELTTTDQGVTPAQLTYTVTTSPTHGTLLKGGASVTSFTQDDVNNGRISYQNDGSKNTSDGFTFTVGDGIDTTAEATFDIHVTLLPPTVTTNAGLTVDQGATATLGSAALATTDQGVTPADLSYIVTTGPSHGTLLKGGASVASFTQEDLNNNLISYQEDGTKTTSDSFTFTVSDGIDTTATTAFNITVTPTPPAVTTNAGLTLNEGATATLGSTALATTDPGVTPAQLTYTVTTGPAHGTLLKAGSAVTSFTQDDLDNNRISYQNDGSKNTTDSFMFTVGDGFDTTAATPFHITVTLLPPTVSTNTGLTVNEGATATLSSAQLATTDQGVTAAQLAYTVTAGPTHGTLLKGGSAVTSFTQDDLNNNRISYRNDGSKNTTDSFTFTVGDGIDTTAATNFHLTVTLLPPTVSTNTGLALNEGATATLGSAQLATTDQGVTPAQLTYTVTAGPTHGTLVKGGSAVTTFTQDDVNNGRISYQNDGSKNTSDSFTFTVGDGFDTTAATPFNITVTLLPPTVTTNTAVTVNQGATIVLGSTNLTTTDQGVTPAQLTYTVTTGPAHGTLLKGGASVTSFTQADLNNNQISYRNDNSKASSDSFTFTVSDGTSTTAAATFNIAVTLQAPTVSTNAGLTVNPSATAVLGSAQLAATDPGTTPAQLTYTVTAGPSHGLLLKGGVTVTSFTQDDLNSNRISYKNDGGVSTSDSFTFTVSDGIKTSASTVFSITVTLQTKTTSPGVTATLVKVKRKKKPALLEVQVKFADSGLVKTQFKSPFQTSAFKRITVQAVDTNGDGVPDAIQVTAFKGKKRVQRVFPVV
jgi:hypothetical protein